MQLFTLSQFSRIGNMPSGEISYLVPGARRFGLTRFSVPGTLQSRAVEVEVLVGGLDAQAYLAAAPSYLVPGARRFGLSRFSVPGTLQSRASAVAGDEGTLISTRDPLVAADRNAAIAAGGGYQAGHSYAVPDVSGPISVAFEEVYDI